MRGALPLALPGVLKGKMKMEIREERQGDEAAIEAVTAAAFAGHPHSDGREPAIVAGLRAAGALHLSLVADEAGVILGHVTFSPVSLNGEDLGWMGLGPVSVLPDRQGMGIGSALIRAGLAQLEAAGCPGVVLLGEPDYYARFGFAAHAGLVLPGVPPAYFMARAFAGRVPTGEVAYHPAFG